jgi:predicted membrane protein
MKSKHFKALFIPIFVFMFVFTIVRKLFDGDFSSETLLKIFLIAFFSSLITGTIFGLINMLWLKKDTIRQFFSK